MTGKRKARASAVDETRPAKKVKKVKKAKRAVQAPIRDNNRPDLPRDQWSRATAAVEAFAAGHVKVASTLRREWQAKLPANAIAQAANAGRDAATPMDRLLQDAVTEDSDALRNGDWWLRQSELSCNSWICGSLLHSGPSLMGAGIYLGIVIQDGLLAEWYLGRTGCIHYRFVEHFVAAFLKLTRNHFYDAARQGDYVVFFPLYHDLSPERLDAAAWQQRAILESIWATLLNSFEAREQRYRGNTVDVNASYRAFRQKFGLVELAGVQGGNNTPCFEAPEMEKSSEEVCKGYRGHVQNKDLLVDIGRERQYRQRLLPATANGDALVHLRLLVLHFAADRAFIMTLSALLLGEGVEWRHLKDNKWQAAFLLNSILERNAYREAVRPFKSGIWRSVLREGEPSSLPCVPLLQRPLFDNLLLVAIADGMDKEVPFHWWKSPLSRSTSDLWHLFLSTLPRSSLNARIDAQKDLIRWIEADRPPAAEWNKMEKAHQRACDGYYLISGQAHIRFHDVEIVCLRPADERGLVGDAFRARAGMVRAYEGKPNILHAACPIKFGNRGSGKNPAVELGKKHVAAEPQWTATVLPIGATSFTSWQHLNFEIQANHKTSTWRPLNDAVDAWQAFDRASSTHVDADLPSLFRGEKKALLPSTLPKVLIGRKLTKWTGGGAFTYAKYFKGKQQYFRITCSAEECARLLGGPWQHPFHSQQIYARITGAGVKREREMGMLVSPDADPRWPKDDFAPGSVNSARAFDYNKTFRAEHEKKSRGEPLSDSIRAKKLLSHEAESAREAKNVTAEDGGSGGEGDAADKAGGVVPEGQA